MKKIIAVIITVMLAFCGTVVFADGAPSYNKNMYNVVVNNREGAEVRYQKYDSQTYESVETVELVPYGTKFIVQNVYEENGESFLTVNSIDYTSSIYWGKINSADVEIYGEPVTPEELRI